jgi:hypothetical protein
VRSAIVVEVTNGGFIVSADFMCPEFHVSAVLAGGGFQVRLKKVALLAE